MATMLRAPESLKRSAEILEDQLSHTSRRLSDLCADLAQHIRPNLLTRCLHELRFLYRPAARQWHERKMAIELQALKRLHGSYEETTHELEQAIRLVKTGARSESLLHRVLLELPDSYRVIMDFTLVVGRRRAQIDAVVIGPYGIYTVEAKHLAAVMVEKADDRTWTKTFRTSSGGLATTTMDDPCAQAKHHAQLLIEMLAEGLGGSAEEPPVKVEPVVTLSGPRELQLKLMSTVPVVKMPKLARFIELRPRKGSGLSDDLLARCVELVLAHAEEPLEISLESMKRQAKRKEKWNLKERERRQAEGK